MSSGVVSQSNLAWAGEQAVLAHLRACKVLRMQALDQQIPLQTPRITNNRNGTENIERTREDSIVQESIILQSPLFESDANDVVVGDPIGHFELLPVIAPPNERILQIIPRAEACLVQPFRPARIRGDFGSGAENRRPLRLAPPPPPPPPPQPPPPPIIPHLEPIVNRVETRMRNPVVESTRYARPASEAHRLRSCKLVVSSF
jgi:hypothetical protein